MRSTRKCEQLKWKLERPGGFESHLAQTPRMIGSAAARVMSAKPQFFQFARPRLNS
jgi:hypothetical protein